MYYSKIENAHAVLADLRLPDLVALLQVDQDDATELSELLRIARLSGWWEQLSVDLYEHFVEFIGLEQGASRVRVFEGRLVTGLAQTRSYASAVVAAAPDVRQDEGWRFVDVRMRRQERLVGSDPLDVDLIMSEAALMQEFDGPEILEEQLRHLLSLIDSSVMTVKVQPFAKTPLGLVTSSTLVLIDFASEHMPTIGWVEGGGQLVTLTDDEALVQSLVINYELAATSSLTPSDSRELIKSRVDALEHQRMMT